jgi:hypothetical protein
MYFEEFRKKNTSFYKRFFISYSALKTFKIKDLKYVDIYYTSIIEVLPKVNKKSIVLYNTV